LSSPEFSVLVVVAILMSRAIAAFIASGINTPNTNNNALVLLTPYPLESTL
jgi:hypothetical protein